MLIAREVMLLKADNYVINFLTEIRLFFYSLSSSLYIYSFALRESPARSEFRIHLSLALSLHTIFNIYLYFIEVH